MNDSASPRPGELFLQFLIIGAVSFGGGIVAYERALFVENKKWLSEDEFMADLALSQTTPGLIAINLAVLAGDRLAGIPGALASVLGLILPGTAFVMMAGFLYELTKTYPIINLALGGIAAGAVGLLAATTYKISAKHNLHVKSLAITATTFALISIFKVPLVWTLAIMLPFGLIAYRPART